MDNFTRNLSFRQKLIGGVTVVLLAMFAEGIFSAIEIRQLSTVVGRAASIHELTGIGTLAADMIGLERAIVLHSIFDDKANVEKFKARLDESAKAFSQALDHTASAASSANTRASIDKLRGKYAIWTTAHNEIISCLQQQQVDVAQKKVSDA